MQKDNKSWHNFLSLDVVKSRFDVGPDLAKWLQPPSKPYTPGSSGCHKGRPPAYLLGGLLHPQPG